MPKNKIKTTGKWVEVADEQVQHIWVCKGILIPDCEKKNVEVAVSPTFYQECGNPVCMYCDCEMEYVRTEVKI